MNVAYIRVSTAEQNEARQLEALEKFGIEKWFKEKVSAKDTNRPQLQELLNFVRENDTVYIHDFSRLARNTKDLLEIVEQLTEKNVALVSNKESIDTSTPTGKLMLTMIGAIYEFERQNLLERQKEGIEIAIRTLGAQAVVCDEIGVSEVGAICELHGGGVPLLASAHAGSLSDLFMRQGMDELHRRGVFGIYIELKRGEGDGYIIRRRRELLDI